ncbi:MAG: ABC transporter permease [Planctomycetaceae bacterium]|nr:ABC transporter permease [Planctomycetaceae bacterium]
MLNFVTGLGKTVSDGLRGIGEIIILLLQCLRWLTKSLPSKAETVRQFYFIGVQSIPVVLITGAFTGAVLAYTSYNQFAPLGVESWTGAIVAKAQIWQLGPVLVGLMLAGRVGCAMTAELGTMNVTEQIDALDIMGTDPVYFLVLPRVLGLFFMTPVLTAFAMLIGVVAGLFMTVFIMGAEWHFQISQIKEWMIPYDYVQGLSKAFIFGLAVALICCRNGLKTAGGAEGVGKATTTANVACCIAILILNLIMSILLYYFQPVWDTIAYYIDSVLLAVSGWIRHMVGAGW